MISKHVACGNPLSISGFWYVTCNPTRIWPRTPMSILAKDAASFKSTLARQDYTSWHSNPAPPQPPGDAGGEEPGEKKKKKKSKTSTCHFPAVKDARPECPDFRCRVLATGRYWYREQCQHTAGLCSCTPQGLIVLTRLEV